MENWPTAGGWPTTGLYPPDGSYGGGHGDNHYLPGGGDSPIDDQVPSNRSSARAPPAQFVSCVKELVSKLKDDEKQAGKNDLEALTIEQQAELFAILVPHMGETFKLRHKHEQAHTGRAQMWGTAVSINPDILSVLTMVLSKCGVVGKITAAELIALTQTGYVQDHKYSLFILV